MISTEKRGEEVHFDVPWLSAEADIVAVSMLPLPQCPKSICLTSSPENSGSIEGFACWSMTVESCKGHCNHVPLPPFTPRVKAEGLVSSPGDHFMHRNTKRMLRGPACCTPISDS